MAPVPAYVRLAEFVSNHDGDTIVLRLDHGKYPTSKAMTEAELRIRNLWCPELSEVGGAEAAEFTRQTLASARELVAQTYKGSFARTVADVWVDGVPLADLVIAAGHGTAVR
jgi:endonuclease YncB( thermonuclease family)